MISGAVVLLFAQKKLSGTQFQKGEHLGYFVDLQSGVISVPAVRTQKLKERIVSLLDTGATARKAADVMDTVISMGLALEPVARLWTRSLYRQVKLRQSWNRTTELTPESMHELHFWKVVLKNLMDNLFGLSPQNVQSLLTLMLVLEAGEDMLCKWAEACQRATFSNLKMTKVLHGGSLQGTFNV